MGKTRSHRQRLARSVLAITLVTALSACAGGGGGWPFAEHKDVPREVVAPVPSSDVVVFIASGGDGSARLYDEQFGGWVDIFVSDRYTSASGRSCARFEARPVSPGSLRGGTWYACDGQPTWYLVSIR
jgi:hypothetical protein